MFDNINTWKILIIRYISWDFNTQEVSKYEFRTTYILILKVYTCTIVIQLLVIYWYILDDIFIHCRKKGEKYKEFMFREK